jgi:hypothetical protein
MLLRQPGSRGVSHVRVTAVLASAVLFGGAWAFPGLAMAGAGSLTTLPNAPVPTGTTTPASTPTPTLGTTPTGPVTVPTPTATSSGGLSRIAEGAIFVAAALVIAGIARVIVRDARSRAPAGDPPSLDRVKGTVAPIEHRLKRSRAKAKRARRARRAGR